jgi:hypothetical protein
MDSYFRRRSTVNGLTSPFVVVSGSDLILHRQGGNEKAGVIPNVYQTPEGCSARAVRDLSLATINVSRIKEAAKSARLATIGSAGRRSEREKK